jgi:hypothetical protein
VSADATWWALTCRACGEVGYAPEPAPDVAPELRAALRCHCPACRRSRPRLRRVAAIAAAAVPEWIRDADDELGELGAEDEPS